MIGKEENLARELRELREQRRAISDVLGAVARSAGLQPVLEEIVEACRRLCDADYGVLYLLDRGLLRAATYHGAPESADYDRQLLIGVVVLVRSEPQPFSDAHIALVQTFADQAAIALTNARLLEAVERQRAKLSRFLSPQVVELITSDDGERLLAGHRAYITCLFCDLRGFTAFAETAAPEELFDVLREYQGALGRLIPGHGGTLEHFAGDGLMVFFNDPVPLDDHELHAVRLALAAQERFDELAAVWRKRGIALGLGVGIEAGYATLGRIGFEGRYDYGAVGPVTNLASRLSTHAGAGQILIGQRVFAAVDETVETAHAGELDLEGVGRAVVAYEVRGLR